MRDLYESLGWLLPAPADFRTRCRELAEASGDVGLELSRLGTYALDENDLRRLAAVVEGRRRAGLSLAPLVPFRLGIVGSGTLGPLAPALVGSAVRHGVALECVVADYGQTLTEALNPASAINAARCDAVLIALDHRELPPPGVDESLAFVRDLRAGFRAHGGSPSIVATVPPPVETFLGSFDRVTPDSPRSRVAAFNAGLAVDVRSSDDVFFDVAALAETVGLGRWHAPTQWNLAKFPFDAAFLPLYAEHAARIVGALRGKSRKCLVLDLDDTLWGGVIGDDGVEGIVVGQGDATGEAFLDVQRVALALRERGIVLAVSSKNEDVVARAGLAHPDMLLRERHIAVLQANWNDKATNLRAIADELSLGVDALVFLDDNPVERALVRDLLPEVAVPELPDDPACYGRTLLAAGYFESVSFSDEDARRAGYYEDNARRATLQRQIGDVEAYLASLEMTIGFRPFDAQGRTRIAQLINKSNQFNLTTRRYTEAEVAAVEGDAACFTLQVRLSDRFGDNGTIGIVICRPRGASVWEIDTWLMSCRVLGRRVEQMTLREIALHARDRGVTRLIGAYVPTPRNAMVADLYAKLGFALVDRDESGASRWELRTDVEIDPAPMSVDRAGFESVAV